MISARLIKDLERKGFRLDFPSYASNEEEIIEILNENNERLHLALPLLLQNEFDYSRIIRKLSKKLTKKFNKIIVISDKIFKLENIGNNGILGIIGKYGIKEKTDDAEFQYYYDSFKDSAKRKEEGREEEFKEQLKIRARLNTNEALSVIFAPGKLRIMGKIFSHEPITNTELKYYYRSIRPLILSILNENLQKYVRIIESVKKWRA